MKRPATGLALVLIFAAAAAGKRAPDPPPGFRAAAADAVVVGKVVEVGDKAEKAELYKGDDREMKVATVRVHSALLGRPGTTVKVGFVLPPAAGGAVRRFPMVELTTGQEACLFLTRHPTKKGVFVLANHYDAINKQGNVAWKAEVDEVKAAAKVLTDPARALRSKDAEQRLLAAALLINRYKTATPSGKTEAVPAAESKLILTALAEADWAAAARGNYRLHPQGLFFQLGATAKDGWERPRDFAQLSAAAQRWLKDKAGTFKMMRYVRDKPGTEVGPEP